jgi:hypothetical protein
LIRQHRLEIFALLGDFQLLLFDLLGLFLEDFGIARTHSRREDSQWK